MVINIVSVWSWTQCVCVRQRRRRIRQSPPVKEAFLRYLQEMIFGFTHRQINLSPKLENKKYTERRWQDAIWIAGGLHLVFCHFILLYTACHHPTDRSTMVLSFVSFEVDSLLCSTPDMLRVHSKHVLFNEEQSNCLKQAQFQLNL